MTQHSFKRLSVTEPDFFPNWSKPSVNKIHPNCRGWENWEESTVDTQNQLS